MKEFYTLKEVAEVFNISLRSVENMVANEKIKSVKIGKSRRVPSSEVEKIKIGGLI